MMINDIGFIEIPAVGIVPSLNNLSGFLLAGITNILDPQSIKIPA